MKKQPHATNTDKLGLKTETLRKITEELNDEQLREVVGGQKKRCTVSATSIP